MGAAACTVSGAYVVSDTAGIAAFVVSKAVATASGANVFVIPSGGNTCYVGVTTGFSPGL